MSEVHHPIFARFYTRLSRMAEGTETAAHRDELLEQLTGHVVEVGAGNGMNFRHYPATVTEVVGVEPEPYLRARALEEADGAPVPVRIVDGVAGRLPFDEASFDAGVASLVLCSVPNQATALAELFRVIRPGGELRFYEHVRAAPGRQARFQDGADTIWPLFAGGCHTGRDTPSAIEDAGFVIEQLRRFRFQPCLLAYPVAPHVIGRARRP